jgi:hypothetical protein
MSYLERALVFAVVGFVAGNLLLTLATVALWRLTRPRWRTARALFALRMLPSVGSIALVAGIILPAFVSYEPRSTSEPAGPAFALFSLLSATVVLAGLRRGLSSWLATRSLERSWRLAARGADAPDFPARVYRVPSSMPFAAVVGILQPRLYVSDRFVDGLSSEERQAVLDHEAAHLAAADNLKRMALRLAPDVLGLTETGRGIERTWAQVSEEEADDQAAGRDRAKALALAAALLHALRSAPAAPAIASSFCEESTIARRVARLLADRPQRRPPTAPGWLRPAGTAALIVAALAVAPALRTIYELTEAAVSFLR